MERLSPVASCPGFENLPRSRVVATGTQSISSGAALVAERREKSVVRALVMTGLLPAALLVICVSRYGVNVPYGDGWLMIPLIEKWQNHQLTLSDIFQQHNEHRIAIPKLIYLAFATLTNWNLRAEMFFSIALCIGTSFGLYLLLKQTVRLSRTQVLLLWCVCNIFIFSPAQAENWLWGFQLQMFIPQLCLVAALVAVSVEPCSLTRWAVGAGLTLIATLSFGNGLLLWPVLSLVMIMRRERRSLLIAWALLGAVVVALYFHHYISAPKSRPITGNWLDYPAYFLVFLGGPLVRQRMLFSAIMIGAAGLTLFGAFFIYFFRRGGQRLHRAAPWLALGSYAVASAAVAAATRVHGEPLQAADSRYLTISQHMYLALIALSVLASGTGETKNEKSFGWLTASKAPLITALVVLALIGFPVGIADMAAIQRNTTTGLAALEFSKVLDTKNLMREQLLVPKKISDPVSYAAILERFNFLGHPVRDTTQLEDAQNRPKRATMEFGETNEVLSIGDNQFQIKGWSFLRERGTPGPAVVLCYREGDQWHAFDICKTGELRRDLAERFHNREYHKAGWSKTFSRNQLPAAAEKISAWTVDPIANVVYKLPPDYILPKTN